MAAKTPSTIPMIEASAIAETPMQPVTDESVSPESMKEEVALLDDRTKEEAVKTEEDVDDLYNIKNFSL